tara:strand:- start:5555 stop:6028 length:474 start_codon:yes stop_codon:yes gene_type:complete
MKRKHSSIRLALGFIAVAFLTGQATASSSLEGTYGAAWRSFSVHSTTVAPPVNTYSMRYATGINVTDNRVQLVSNGGNFVRDGHSQPINQQVYANLELRPKCAPTTSKKSFKFRKSQRVAKSATFASHRKSSSVKVPVIGHAGRFVGKLFGKNRKVA